MRALILVVALSLAGCAAHTAPETTVARYGSTVLGSAAALQRGITDATDQKVLPVATAQRMTAVMEQLYAKSGTLSDALKTYHAATSIDLRKASAANVIGLVGEINTLTGQLLGTSMPEAALGQITKLVGNVMAAVGAVQAEVASGLK